MSYYRYTSRVTGAIWKPITCPHCGCQYAYLMKREGAGEERTVLFDIGGKDAAQSAKQHALNDLERQLNNEFEVVHCPDCGKYPPQIEKYIYEQRRGTPLIKVLMIVIIVIGILSCLRFALASPDSSILIIGVHFISICAIYLVINRMADNRIARYDPNAYAARRRNMAFGKDYPVLRRAELEDLAKHLTLTSTQNIDVPHW